MSKKHRKEKKEEIPEKELSLFLVLGILSGLILLFLGRFLVTDKMIFGHDLKLIAYYFNSVARDFLSNLKPPFWLPTIFSGMPLLSSMNTIIFYPTELIYTFLRIPVEIGFNYDFIIHVFIAGFSMYLFARSLGLKFRGALFSSIVFMSSGSLITIIYAGHMNTVKAISLIPLFFYFFESGLKYLKIKYFVLAGVVIGLQFLSLGMQVLTYTLLFAFFYFIFRKIWDSPIFLLKIGTVPMMLKLSFCLIIMVLVSIGISAVQLLPSYEYLQISHRGKPTYEFFTSWSFHPLEAITLVIPEFFGLKDKTYWGHNLFCLATDYSGILPLVLCCVAVLFMYKNKIVLFFLFISLLTLFLSFGKYTPLYGILYHIPVLSNFRNPTRFLILFTFSISLLSGFGLQFLFEEDKIKNTKRWRIFRTILIIFVCISLLIIFLFTIQRDNIVSYMQNLSLIKDRFTGNLTETSLILYNLIKNGIIKLFIFLTLSSIFILYFFVRKINKNIVLSIFILIFLIDIWIINSQFLKTFDIKEAQKDDAIKFLLEKDKSLYRIAPFGNLFNKNTFAENGLHSIGGYHGLPVARYLNFVEKIGISNINLLNILNVKYILISEPIEHPKFKLVYDGPTKIYENMLNLPRTYLANKISKYSDINLLFNRIKEQNFLPDKEVLFDTSEFKLLKLQELPEQIESDNIPETSFQQEVKIVSYSSERITISAKSNVNSMLVLSEVYISTWKAKVDGIDTSVYPAYGLLRSIYVPKGEHKIDFFYDGKTFYIGAIISIITLVILSIIGIVVIIRKRKI